MPTDEALAEVPPLALEIHLEQWQALARRAPPRAAEPEDGQPPRRDRRQLLMASRDGDRGACGSRLECDREEWLEMPAPAGEREEQPDLSPPAAA